MAVEQATKKLQQALALDARLDFDLAQKAKQLRVAVLIESIPEQVREGKIAPALSQLQ